jgi:hypothetical protein
VAALLEKVQKGVPHAGSTPLVLLVDVRHVCGRGAQASGSVGQLAVRCGRRPSWRGINAACKSQSGAERVCGVQQSADGSSAGSGGQSLDI